jgi:hypothetical protein
MNRRRLSALLSGSIHRPRARIVVCGLIDGTTRAVAVPATGPLRQVFDTIESLRPSWLETYAEDPPNQLLHREELARQPATELTPTGNVATTAASPSPTIVATSSPATAAIAESQRFSHIADLIAQGYDQGHVHANASHGDVIRQLVQLAEHQAMRAERAERTADRWHAAMLQQSQNWQAALFEQQQALIEAERQAASQGDGGNAHGLMPILENLGMGLLAGLANRPDGLAKAEDAMKRIGGIVSDVFRSAGNAAAATNKKPAEPKPPGGGEDK